MPDFEVRIALTDVAEGDATDLAQQIWDAHAEGFDAARGDFDIVISKGGFPVDWVPKEAA